MSALEFLKCREDSLPPKSGKRVAIVGGGPAGLTAAGYLVCLGHSVTIYDRNPELGGTVLYGIPDLRFPKDVVRRSVEKLLSTGRVEHVRAFVGKDVALEEVISSGDATLIATGAWKSKRLGVEGEDANGVYGGLEWLVDYARVKRGLLPAFYKKPLPLEEPVVIIGAGYTALDLALVAALELGLKVAVVYRRSRKEAPMGEAQVARLEKIGVAFLENLAPARFLVDGRGRVSGVVCKSALGSGEEVVVPARTVMLAAGLSPTPPPGAETSDVKVLEDGRIYVDEKYRTTRRSVFAAGDVVTGAANIAKAALSGLEAARSIHEYLRGSLGWSDYSKSLSS